MPARASLSFEDGMRTVSCMATLPLRIRVSMSALGSVIVTCALLPSPARLGHTRHLAVVDHLAKTDPAQPELAVDGARPSTAPASGVGPHPELGLALLLLDQCLLGQFPSWYYPRPRRGGRRERLVGSIIPGMGSPVRNGNPNAASRARPSSSVRAVVQIVMSMPRTVSMRS